MLDAIAVAEIRSMHGDPEAFGEREIKALVDIQRMPYGTKLYAAQVQRKPLTAEQLDDLCEKQLFSRASLKEFSRTIEAAHGIKAAP